LTKKLANQLLPIKDSFSQLEARINSLTIQKGSCLNTALAFSVLLASHFSDSEIILCTDGYLEDRNEQMYESISKYCDNYSIKINLVSFDDCDLTVMTRIASVNQRSPSQPFDEFKFEKFYNEIIEESIRKPSITLVDLTLIGDYELIHLDRNKSHKLELNNVESNEKEILIEYSLLQDVQNMKKEFIYFQLQINLKRSVRVITTRVRLKAADVELNAELVHAYSIRKLMRISFNDEMSKNFLDEYTKFASKQTNEVINQNKTIDLVQKLSADERRNSELLNLNSFELKSDTRLTKLIETVQTTNKQIANLIVRNEKETIDLDSESVDFKSKLKQVLDSFNLNNRENNVKNEKLAKQHHVAVGLAEHALSLIKPLRIKRSSLEANKFKSPFQQQIQNLSSQDILNELSDIEILFAQNLVTTEWPFHRNEQLYKSLTDELNQFIKSSLNDTNHNGIKLISSISSQLIHKAKEFAFNVAEIAEENK